MSLALGGMFMAYCMCVVIVSCRVQCLHVCSLNIVHYGQLGQYLQLDRENLRICIIATILSAVGCGLLAMIRRQDG